VHKNRGIVEYKIRKIKNVSNITLCNTLTRKSIKVTVRNFLQINVDLKTKNRRDIPTKPNTIWEYASFLKIVNYLSTFQNFQSKRKKDFTSKKFF
jgi:hypothetical protein